MSLANEWFLAVHRAIWFPVLYVMGLEGEPVEVYPIDRGLAGKLEAVPAGSGRITTAVSHRGAPRKKAA